MNTKITISQAGGGSDREPNPFMPANMGFLALKKKHDHGILNYLGWNGWLFLLSTASFEHTCLLRRLIKQRFVFPIRSSVCWTYQLIIDTQGETSNSQYAKMTLKPLILNNDYSQFDEDSSDALTGKHSYFNWFRKTFSPQNNRKPRK